jgi:hypothetical protein
VSGVVEDDVESGSDSAGEEESEAS